MTKTATLALVGILLHLASSTQAQTVPGSLTCADEPRPAFCSAVRGVRSEG